MKTVIDRRANPPAVSELPYGYSCAFCGAFLAAAVMKGCGVVTHCSPGCNFSLTITQLGASSRFSKPLNFATTLLTEKNVILGGEKRLFDTLVKASDSCDVEFQMVLTGCSAETIGDDISEIANRVYSKTGKPVVTVNSGGYTGNTVDGYNKALKAIAEQLIIDGDIPRQDKSVNIIGIVPVHDLFWRGNINEMTRLVKRLGASVNTVLAGDGMSLSDIKKIPAASLNAVVSDNVGIEAVSVIQKKFNVPSLICTDGYPIGSESSSLWIEKVGRAIGVHEDKINEVISDERNSVYSGMANYVSALNDVICRHRYFLHADSFYTLGIFSYLTGEIGMMPEVISVSTCNENTLVKIKELCEKFSVDPVIAIDPDNSDIEMLIEETKPTLIIGKGEDIHIARKKKIPLLGLTPTNLSRIQSYPLPTIGFNGGLVLIDEIFRECVSGRQ